MKINKLTPIDDNAAIWKYMGFAEFLALLINEEIHFSNLSDYKDKFEGMLLLDQIHERDKYLPKINGKVYPTYEEERKKFNEEKKGVIINCWSQYEHENYHLWKNYDPSSKYGIALKTTFSKLEESFGSVDNEIQELQVSYVKYTPLSYPDVADSLTNRIINKPPEYDIEKEIRIFQTGLDKSRYLT